MKHFAAILYLTLCEIFGIGVGILIAFALPKFVSVSAGSAVLVATGCCLIAFGVSMERWRRYRHSH